MFKSIKNWLRSIRYKFLAVHEVTLVGGYNGVKGSVTCFNTIYMVSPPSTEMTFSISGSCYYAEEIYSCRNEVSAISWSVSVDDHGDSRFIGFSMQEIIDCFENEGWYIDDYEDLEGQAKPRKSHKGKK